MNKLMRASILTFFVYISTTLLIIIKLLKGEWKEVLWDSAHTFLVFLLCLFLLFGLMSIVSEDE